MLHPVDGHALVDAGHHLYVLTALTRRRDEVFAGFYVHVYLRLLKRVREVCVPRQPAPDDKAIEDVGVRVRHVADYEVIARKLADQPVA